MLNEEVVHYNFLFSVVIFLWNLFHKSVLMMIFQQSSTTFENTHSIADQRLQETTELPPTLGSYSLAESRFTFLYKTLHLTIPISSFLTPTVKKAVTSPLWEDNTHCWTAIQEHVGVVSDEQGLKSVLLYPSRSEIFFSAHDQHISQPHCYILL